MCNSCPTITQESFSFFYLEGIEKNRKKENFGTLLPLSLCMWNVLNLVTMFYGRDFLQRLLMHWLLLLFDLLLQRPISGGVHWHNAKRGWSAPLIPKLKTFLDLRNKKKNQGFFVPLFKKKLLWPTCQKGWAHTYHNDHEWSPQNHNHLL